MKTVKTICVIFVITLLSCQNTQATSVSYDLANLGGSQYEYTYSISNDMLAMPIEEFTIWFNVDLCENLTITTQQPLASQWDELILKETGFGLPIGYDTLALTGGIQPTETVSGFSVRFDWSGQGLPGPQYFEIINPITFETVDSGLTIPEPSTFLMLTLSGLIVLLKAKRAR